VAESTSDISAHWKHLVMRAGISYVAGDWGAADEQSAEANKWGHLYGIPDAPAVFTAQFWYRSWLVDKHGDLAPLLAAADENLFRTDIARAARVSTWIAAGEIDRARSDGEDLLASHLTNGSSFGLIVPVVLVDLALATSDDSLVRRVESALAGRRQSAPLVGLGLGTIGPVDYHLGRLAVVGSTERQQLLDAGRSFADRARLLPWQIKTRLEPANEMMLEGNANEHARLLAEAAQLAAPSPFIELLPG
jgi:hypothetical protein